MNAAGASGGDAQAVCALPGCSKVIREVASGEARRYCCPAHRKIARKRRRDQRPTPDASTTALPEPSNAQAPAGVGAAAATGAMLATGTEAATDPAHSPAAAELAAANARPEPPAGPVPPPSTGAITVVERGDEVPARPQYRRLVPEPRPRWFRRSTRPYAMRGLQRNRPRFTLPPLPSDPEWLRPALYHQPEPRRTVIHVGRPDDPRRPQAPLPAPQPPTVPPPRAAAAPAMFPPPAPHPYPWPATVPPPMPPVTWMPVQAWPPAPAPAAPAPPPVRPALPRAPRLEPSVETTQPIQPVSYVETTQPFAPDRDQTLPLRNEPPTQAPPTPAAPTAPPPLPPPTAPAPPTPPPPPGPPVRSTFAAYPTYPTPSSSPEDAPPAAADPSTPDARSVGTRAREALRGACAWGARQWSAMVADEGPLAMPHAALTQLLTRHQERKAATEDDRLAAEALLRGVPLPGEPVNEPKRRKRGKRRPPAAVFQAAENTAWAGQMREALLAALHSLTINKLRSLLTTIGIVVGVAAVIVLVAMGDGMKANFDVEFGKFANQITVTQAKSATPSGQASRNLTDRDVKALGDTQQAPDIAAISPAIVGNVPLSEGQNKDKAVLIGASGNYLDLLNRHLVAGQWFSEAQLASGARATVIGQESLNQLWGTDTNPQQVLGAQIRIGHSLFTVQGVLATDGQNDRTAIVPFAAARSHLVGDRGGKVDLIIIKSTSPATVEQATSEVFDVLDRQHNIHSSADRDFNAQNYTELLRKEAQYINFLTIFIVAVAAISLFVGGIGVANIMLVSVTERTREIGIRKAIGAKTSAILRQFLSEAVMLTGLGGLVGIVLGLGLTQLAIVVLPSFGAGDPSSGDSDGQIPLPVMSVAPVLISFVVSLIIGVLAGVYPANRAARLRPIDALRFE